MQSEILLVKKLFEHIMFTKKAEKIEELPLLFKDNLYELADNVAMLKDDCSYAGLIIIRGYFLSIREDLYEVIKLIDYCLRRNYVPKKIDILFTGGLGMQQFLMHIVDKMILLKSSVAVTRASYEHMHNVYGVLEKFTKHDHYLKQKTEYQTYVYSCIYVILKGILILFMMMPLCK